MIYDAHNPLLHVIHVTPDIPDTAESRDILTYLFNKRRPSKPAK